MSSGPTSRVTVSRDTVPSVAPAEPLTAHTAPSSDTQVVTELVKRHRLITAAVTGGVVLALAGALYVGRAGRTPPSAAPLATPFEDFRIVQLTSTGNAERPAISPDGKYVAYIQHDGNDYSLRIRQVTTASNVEIVKAEPHVVLDGATVTPDGSFVDFVRRERNRAHEIWRVPLLGGTPKRLIEDVGSPVGWAPDGQRLAFVRAARDGSWQAVIVADADGSHQRRLAIRRLLPALFLTLNITGNPSIRPAWSPDGRVIALPGRDEPHGVFTSQVVFVDVATGSQRTVALPSGVDLRGLAWSSPESLMLTQAGEMGAFAQLSRVSYPAGQLSRLTNDSSDYAEVSLTADAGSLVTAQSETLASIWVGKGVPMQYTEAVPPMVSTLVGNHGVAWAGERLLHTAIANGQFWVAAVTPGSAERDEPIAKGSWPAATSNGRTIVFFSREAGGGRGLWKADADGRHAVQLVPGSTIRAAITRDDRHVVFIWDRIGLPSPWIVPIEGGRPNQVAKVFAGAQMPPDVSPDGRSIVLASRDEQGGAVSWSAICPLARLADPFRRRERGENGCRTVVRSRISTRQPEQTSGCSLSTARHRVRSRISLIGSSPTSPGRETANASRSCGRRSPTTSCC